MKQFLRRKRNRKKPSIEHAFRMWQVVNTIFKLKKLEVFQDLKSYCENQRLLEKFSLSLSQIVIDSESQTQSKAGFTDPSAHDPLARTISTTFNLRQGKKIRRLGSGKGNLSKSFIVGHRESGLGSSIIS